MANGSEIEELQLGGGRTVLVEVREVAGSEYRRIGKKTGETPPEFKTALQQIKPAAEMLLETVTDLVKEPKEVEISFGIKIAAKLGAIIASSSAEGNFSVTIKWVKG